MKTMFCLLFTCWFLNAQASIIEIKAWVKPSSAPEIKNEQFILLDFWATWCGPCIKAMDHMAELRMVTQDRVVYVSLTNESEEKAIGFFSNREAKTWIAVDDDNKTFDKFKVTSLPYSVLIAPDGSIVWQGRPSDLNFSNIQALTSKSYPSKPIQTKLWTKAWQKKEVKKDLSVYKFKNDITTKFTSSMQVLPFNKAINPKDQSIEYAGEAREIIASIMDIAKHHVHKAYTNDVYGYFSVNTLPNQNNREDILSLFLESFGLDQSSKVVQQDGYQMLVVDTMMLWNEAIYEWNADASSSYIYYDNYLQADNYSMTDISILLSDFLQLDIDYTGNYLKKHDWNLNLTDVESLKNQLADEFGIQLTPKTLQKKEINLFSK